MTEEVKKEEVVVEEPQVEVPEAPSLEEQRATADGWQPKDKWVEAGNNERDHRTAREFNDRGELLKKISEQNRYIQRVNQNIDVLKGHHSKVFESAHKKALEDLKREHAAAVEEGKIDLADRIVDKISDEKVKFVIQQAQGQAQQQPSGPAPELLEWQDKNPWYLEDDAMRAYADQQGFKYANERKNQVTPTEVLAFVEKKVKERFMKTEPKKEAAPAPVGGASNTQQKVQAKGPSLRKSELDEDELKAMKSYVEMKLGNEAEYLAELAKIR